jgi:hypothetical protein
MTSYKGREVTLYEAICSDPNCQYRGSYVNPKLRTEGILTHRRGAIREERYKAFARHYQGDTKKIHQAMMTFADAAAYSYSEWADIVGDLLSAAGMGLIDLDSQVLKKAYYTGQDAGDTVKAVLNKEYEVV